MWTPRRIVMLTGCFLVFFVGYLGYSTTAIGRMDGLPPLPENYWPVPDDGTPVVLHNNSATPLTKKIKLAFGPDCVELKRAIRLDLNAKNMVISAEQFQVIEGRVSLTPISVAVFGKPRADGAPEISTISGDTAWLKFDRPVTNFSEIGSRKVVEAEIQGRIEIRNNRARAERDEDLQVQIYTGPLYYREKDHLVWTHDHVKLVDHKSKPKPHVITGKGMKMELHHDSPSAAPSPKPHKAQKEAISGINWIALHSTVVMDLYIDGKNGLISSGSSQGKPAPTGKPPATAKSPTPAQPPEKAWLHITCPGPFRYDIHKDHDIAQFDIAPPGPQPMRNPQHVEVIRTNEKGERDDLVCHHLTLRLRRKEAGAQEKAPAKGEKEGGEGAEIETVHATGPTGVLTLTSDAEKMTATGNDFFHDAVKGYTLLKGDPELEVIKDGSQIFARELTIQDVKPPVVPAQPEPKPFQNIWAKGPGRIHMTEKNPPPVAGQPGSPKAPGKPVGPKTTHAYWDTLLTSTKDNGEDLLTLTGNARFVDEATGQSLKADLLKVWLEDAEKAKSTPVAAAAAAKPASSAMDTTAGRRPRHLEGTGNVVARLREINIHDASRLVVWFKDVPATTHMPPPGTVAASPRQEPRPSSGAAVSSPSGNRVAAPSDTPTKGKAKTAQPMPRGPQTQNHANSKSASKPAKPSVEPADTTPPARPFDLTARSIEAKILRSTIKSTIDELWCEGAVEVHQDPAAADEKGTNVKGDTLKMTARGLDLYYLVVTGDLGELQTDKIYIIGPEINIDQATNKAWVIGDGAMKMDSATNFQGEKLDKPVPLTVHWHKSMLFNGASAEFHGNIQGEQEKARLACQRLHVFFDRTISLREGNKKDDPAKVKSLVRDREVRIEDSTYEGEKLVKWIHLVSPGVQMDALEPEDDLDRGRPGFGPGLPAGVRPVVPTGSKPGAPAKANGGNLMVASGPGNVRIWEPGDSDTMGPPIQGKPGPDGKSATAPGQRTTAAKPAAPPGNKSAKNVEMKMTYVEFQKRMDANTKTNTALFYENVRVLNLPAKRPDIPIDLDVFLASELPEGALYMRCNWLKVLDHPSNGKPNKQMEGTGRVFVQSKEFYAYADKVTYNQQKEQVIFYGENGYATLYKQDSPGSKPQVLEGKKIIHSRLTGQTQVIDAREVNGFSVPTRSPSGAAPTRSPSGAPPPKVTPPGQR